MEKRWEIEKEKLLLNKEEVELHKEQTKVKMLKAEAHFMGQDLDKLAPHLREYYMSIVIVSVIFILMVCALAYRADAWFYREERLPMQWWITGEVTWSAPWRLALAFMPALAIVSLGFVTIMALSVAPQAGQEGRVLLATIGMGATLVAVQLLHFWLIARTLRR